MMKTSQKPLAVKPRLLSRVEQRQKISQRLTVFYVASLSAIAGLSILGQVVIQAALSHQSTDIEVMHATLGHKDEVGSALRSFRSLRRVSGDENRKVVLEELAEELEEVQAGWQELIDLSGKEQGWFSHRHGYAEGMVAQLKPRYDQVWQQLQQAPELSVGESPAKAQAIQPSSTPRRQSGSPPRRPPRTLPERARPQPRAEAVSPAQDPIKALERTYMRQIDKSLEAYNQSVAVDIQKLKRLELFLLSITLLVLVLEGALIFKPAVQQTHDALAALEFSLDKTQRTATQLASEQKKSEKLLLNILPQSIAQRLKQKHQPIADAFEEVTVLFADIVGFTELSSQMPPQKLVRLLNRIFSSFDALVDQQGLEKIKTIGDAYMVMGGLPQPRADHAEAIVQLALQMQSAIAHFNQETGHDLSIRIGINSGPVVAGVIGTKKFIYDLWGDTVNLASRMESHGQPGRIQISESTAQLIGDRFPTQSRGRIEIKGKGTMVTYWIGDRTAYSPIPMIVSVAEASSRGPWV